MSPYNRVICCLLCSLASRSSAFAGIITVTNNADTYTWINTGYGIIAGHGIDLPNTLPGNYKLIASNSLGCRDSTGIFYAGSQSPPVMDSSRVVISPDICGLSDGSLTGLVVNGRSPVSFEWFSLAGNSVAQTQDLHLLSAGQYYLRVNDVRNRSARGNLCLDDELYRCFW